MRPPSRGQPMVSPVINPYTRWSMRSTPPVTTPSSTGRTTTPVTGRNTSGKKVRLSGSTGRQVFNVGDQVKIINDLYPSLCQTTTINNYWGTVINVTACTVLMPTDSDVQVCRYFKSIVKLSESHTNHEWHAQGGWVSNPRPSGVWLIKLCQAAMKRPRQEDLPMTVCIHWQVQWFKGLYLWCDCGRRCIYPDYMCRICGKEVQGRKEKHDRSTAQESAIWNITGSPLILEKPLIVLGWESWIPAYLKLVFYIVISNYWTVFALGLIKKTGTVVGRGLYLDLVGGVQKKTHTVLDSGWVLEE